MDAKTRITLLMFLMEIHKNGNHRQAMREVDEIEAWSHGSGLIQVLKEAPEEAPSAPNGESVSKPPRIDDLEVLGKLQEISDLINDLRTGTLGRAGGNLYMLLTPGAKEAVNRLEKLIHDLLAGRELP